MIAVISAGLLWLVPYEVKHHKITNAAALEIAQVHSDFDEYRMYQEYRYLMEEKAKRKLSPYEEDRLSYLAKVLEKLRLKRYR